jgi:hypothetical protein
MFTYKRGHRPAEMRDWAWLINYDRFMALFELYFDLGVFAHPISSPCRPS